VEVRKRLGIEGNIAEVGEVVLTRLTLERIWPAFFPQGCSGGGEA
jgi:hypothetical protein